MKASEVPGAAVAIVENGKVTLARGYGIRQLGSPRAGRRRHAVPDRLDHQGVHHRGARDPRRGRQDRLGRQGDRPPAAAFACTTPGSRARSRSATCWCTAAASARARATCCSCRSTEISRADSVRRLRFLKPATSFRSSFAYDNVLYMVAGQLIEAVTGQTWEEFIDERILKPIGMTSSVTNDVDRLSRPGPRLPARPHRRVARRRPAAALRREEGRARRELRPGRRDRGRRQRPRALARGAARVRQTSGFGPAAVLGRERAGDVAAGRAGAGDAAAAALADATPQFRGYALGWVVQDYRGHKIIQHGGGTQGFRAVVVLIPEKNVGFAIVNNSEDNEFVPGLEYELLDHYLGLPKHDWPKAFEDFFDERNADGLEAQQAAEPRARGPRPRCRSRATRANTPIRGTGRSPSENAGRLSIDFKQTPGMVAPLEHWAYDTFVARWPDPLIEPAFVTFALDAAGKPARITMKALLAGRGLQLRLPRPRVHAGRAGALSARRRRKEKGPGAIRAGPLTVTRSQITWAAERPRNPRSLPATQMPSCDPRRPRR